MTNKTRNELRRVLLALTDNIPLAPLWNALTSQLEGSPAEVVAIFVTDERWRRAARLPFTREISKVSGSSANFTEQRAEQLHKEHFEETRKQVRELAAESNLELIFELLSESDAGRIRELVEAGHDVVIAPAYIATRPIYAEIVRLECHILLVETDD